MLWAKMTDQHPAGRQSTDTRGDYRMNAQANYAESIQSTEKPLVRRQIQILLGASLLVSPLFGKRE
jgi:hypothetical protein